MASTLHLEFVKTVICNCVYDSNSRYVSLCKISCWSVKPMLRYGGFSIFQTDSRPPSWNCYNARLDHPRRVFGNIYHCVKFGSNADLVGFIEQLQQKILRLFKDLHCVVQAQNYWHEIQTLSNSQFNNWATLCKTVRPMLSDRCLVCPVCMYYVTLV